MSFFNIMCFFLLLLSAPNLAIYAQYAKLLEESQELEWCQEDLVQDKYRPDDVDNLFNSSHILATPTFDSPSGFTIWFRSMGIALLYKLDYIKILILKTIGKA